MCIRDSINLARMTKGPLLEAELDWDLLAATVHAAVRFLDNVIDMNQFPLPEIGEMTRGNRKIGLGVMGFADLLFKLGLPYDSEQSVEIAERLASFVRKTAWDSSVRLAQARHPLPALDGSLWDTDRGGRPVRNASVTTIAPTGTISISAGCSKSPSATG